MRTVHECEYLIDDNRYEVIMSVLWLLSMLILNLTLHQWMDGPWLPKGLFGKGYSIVVSSNVQPICHTFKYIMGN